MFSRVFRSSAIAATRHIPQHVATRRLYRLPVSNSVKQNLSTTGLEFRVSKRVAPLGSKTLGFFVGAVAAVVTGSTCSMIHSCISLPLMGPPFNVAACQGSETVKDWTVRKPVKIEELSIGFKIDARWKINGGFYSGWVEQINTDGTVDVLFEDGDERKSVPLHEIRHTSTSKSATTTKWNSNWDNRAGNGTKGQRRLIFVRHGAYNAAANDKGRTLTTVGRIQACETGVRIAHVYGEADHLVFSTMVRATETSEIITDVLVGLGVKPKTIESDDSIREGMPIEPSPNPTNWGDAASFERDGARIEAAFKKHVHRADADATGLKTTIFVCHGNVIRYFTMRALQVNPSAWLRTTVANGSITEMTVLSDGQVVLTKFGDSGHMKPVLVTS